MATIKLKNGSGAPLASDLVQGEPALDLTNKRLYTEDSLGAVIEVGVNPSSLTIGGTALTATATELNTLDGITATTAELNIMDGVTATALELNVLDGVTATTAELNTLDGVTATFAEINTLDGITATTAELNILDGVTATAANLNVLAGTTLTAADLPYFDRSDNTSGWVEDSKVVIADSAGSIQIRDGGTLSWNNNNLVIRNAYNSSSTFDATYPVKFEGEKWTFRQQDFTEMAVFEAGGVDLKKDGTSRLTTTTSGVDVTGTVTADGLTSQAGANATDILTLSGSAAGRTLSVQSYDTTLGGAGFDINASASAGEITLQTNTTDRLRVEATGDISFYEDTGTTAKLTWDASAETLNFADNGKAVFGAGSDLQIYHDGSNSYIDDDGVGNLFLRADNQLVLKSKTQDENYLQAIAGGELRLFHDGVQKLRTEATGIDVTGSLSADGLTVDGTATISEGSSGATAPSDSNTLIVENNGNAGAVILTPDGSSGQLRFGDVTDGSSAFVQYNSTDNLMTVGTSRASGELRFTTGNVGERVRIDANGNVGIGTNSPDTLLELVGDDPVLTIRDSATSSSTANATLRLAETGASDTLDAYWDIKAVGGALQFIDNWNEGGGTGTRLVIDDSGNVGIGTDAPAKELHISSSAPDIRLQDSDGTNQYAEITESGGSLFIGSRNDASNGALIFRGLGGGAADEHMRIDADGNVGIGTSSPAENLHVDGNIRFGDSSPAHLYTNSNELRLGVDNNNDNATSDITFYVDSSEKMRIDSAGNVGLGITTPDSELHVFGTGSGDGTFGPSITIGKQNGPKISSTQEGTDNDIQGLAFFTKSSATLADPATEAMRIDSTGNVGIGTDSPNQLLSINSTITGERGISFDQSGVERVKLLYTNSSGAFTINNTTAGYTSFENNGSEAMRINSSGTVRVSGTNNVPLELQNSATSGNCRISLQTADYGVVSIGQQATGTVTVYDNVTSETTFSVGPNKVLTATGGLAGIQLGGATVSNQLDDYEEGTFTPELADASSVGNTATTTTATGVYTKIGNLVTLNMRFTDIDTTGLTGANTLFIRNMPFTNAALAQNQCEGPARMDLVDVPTGAYSATFASVANSTYGSIRLSVDNSNDVQVKVQDISSGSSDILITITHFV